MAKVYKACLIAKRDWNNAIPTIFGKQFLGALKEVRQSEMFWPEICHWEMLNLSWQALVTT